MEPIAIVVIAVTILIIITLYKGINIVFPYIETVRQRITTRDIILEIPQQEVITKDNAVILTNAVAFIRVTKPENALYGVEDFRVAIQQLIMTTLRSILGEMTLDEALSNRERIKNRLKESIIDDVADWGVTVKSVEIQDINPSASMQDSMERQAAAERERRAIETTAEGNKNAAILEADGKLEASIREAKAQVLLAKASSQAIQLISDTIQDKELPAMFLLGDRYINALEKMSESDNAKFVIYPADLQGAIKGMLGNVFKK
ncbi:Putative stomatin/prohibitin-family membrane protease subunit YbbK [hydrothermal vent metagenome]|uniref:Putative stomatin/prohibitin-family membrane protease subunit YbbK n=1 Tax=hydrothermal vent metagenome TaxID=652676 RepID=A0A1W1CWR7_9ZZZZ